MRAAALLLLAVAACGGGDQGARATVTIPRGATFSQAVDSLSARGIIRHEGWFRLYARARGLPGELKSGIYTFRVDNSWGDVVTTLKAGRGAEVRFTVLEGMMAFEIAERARVWLRIPRDSFTTWIRELMAVRRTALPDDDVIVLENLRFDPGEEANDPAFAGKLADVADAYVDDAFGAVHRPHASVSALPELMLASGRPAVAGRRSPGSAWPIRARRPGWRRPRRRRS